MAALQEIARARDAGRRVRVDIDVTALSVLTCAMTTREVGREWLNLLRGRASELEPCVVRVRSKAPGRAAPPGWAATRLRIFERDGHCCTYCGSSDGLECDHIVAVASGGSDDDDNLTTACGPCNRSKGARSVEEWRA
jgi:hypothetical protein